MNKLLGPRLTILLKVNASLFYTSSLYTVHALKVYNVQMRIPTSQVLSTKVHVQVDSNI